MYKVSIKAGESIIEGKGVFANEDISKDAIAWIYEEGHDQTMSCEDYEKLSREGRAQIDKIGYLSPWTNRWVFPPTDDLAVYTNHSDQNNLSAVFDADVSVEPYFVANRDIKAGEEITNNYYEFDLLTRETRPDWAK